MFLMFITTPSFAYQSLILAELIHDSLANIYALSTSQPPIRQLEQKSLGLGNVWVLVWTPDCPLGNVQCTGNNSNKRSRLKVRPAGIGTQSFSWLAVWPYTSHLNSHFLHLQPKDIELNISKAPSRSVVSYVHKYYMGNMHRRQYIFSCSS